MKRNNDRLLNGKLSPRMTFSEAAEVWRRLVSPSVSSIRFYSPRTIKYYEGNIRFLNKHFGDVALGDITAWGRRQSSTKNLLRLRFLQSAVA